MVVGTTGYSYATEGCRGCADVDRGERPTDTEVVLYIPFSGTKVAAEADKSRLSFSLMLSTFENEYRVLSRVLRIELQFFKVGLSVFYSHRCS